MGLEDYDLYAIKTYSFTVRKTHTFFSLPTVLLSLAVFAIAIMINFNTVRHLWLPLSDLDIISSSSIQLPDPLTTTLLCVKPSDPANKNRFAIFRSDKVALQFKALSEENVGQNYPELKSQIGSGFGCVDLQGFSFVSVDDVLYVEAQDTAATIFIKTNSVTQVLFKTVEPATVLSSNRTSSTPIYPVMFLKSIVYDRLYLNYDPQVTNTFMNNSNYIYNEIKKAEFNTNYTYFKLAIYYPSSSDNDNIPANLFTINVNRKNLGDIFGAVLSWISILALIISFIAAPLMDMTLNLLTVESLYHLEPHMQNPSLLKFMVAQLRKGIFLKQDQYVKMCEQIQKMKDVNRIVKLQMLLYRLIPKSNNKTSHQLISSQHNFNQVVKNQNGVQLFTDKTESRPLNIDVSQDQKDQNCISSIKSQLLCLLDEGSDPVSVSYKQGGIGSKTSFCVFLLAGVGLLTFLIIFGLLKSQSTIVRSKNSAGQQSYVFNPYNIFFSVASGDSGPILSIVDGNFKEIEKMSLVNQSECISYLSSREMNELKSSAPLVYCIASTLQLVRSNDPQLTRMLKIYKQGSNTYPLYIKESPQNSYFKPISKTISLTPQATSNIQYIQIPLMVVDISCSQLKTQTYQLLPEQTQFNYINKQYGNFIRINDYDLSIRQESTSFFDALQNVWTFTIVCFTVIVMKLTKYINLRHKQESYSPQKVDFRDSICIMLARLNGLLHGRHQEQLEHTKYYIKEPLPVL